ncbi:MAG: sigma-70 family RNA polymerase sigma factor [Clostridia bacterium]|nr:sigma-70 family RNA polymerase sigma factor [Oscillospiraceae bacterium]MBQ6702579.1 sigma-70 family RNA polymerase sigma factor [Clostridia bacterium]
MEDKDIIQLYFERSEKAIEATNEKYGRYCRKIAYNILYSDLDAEECVNDTYLNAWNAIPPQNPHRLSAFLGRITRNLALKKYAHSNAKKRKGECVSVISELDECIPSTEGSDVADEIALKMAVNGFLESLNPKTRIVFFQRYWYFLSIKEIALENSMTETNVKVSLKRTREKFKTHLEKEGIIL